MMSCCFNATPTTEITTLSLRDALPICTACGLTRATGLGLARSPRRRSDQHCDRHRGSGRPAERDRVRSEEHTSELQSQSNLVCRLLLEKKKQRQMAPLLQCRALRTKAL